MTLLIHENMVAAFRPAIETSANTIFEWLMKRPITVTFNPGAPLGDIAELLKMAAHLHIMMSPFEKETVGPALDSILKSWELMEHTPEIWVLGAIVQIERATGMRFLITNSSTEWGGQLLSDHRLMYPKLRNYS